MKTDCKNIQALLIDFADKKLSAAQSEMVSQHLNGCRSCSQELDEIVELFQLMNEKNEVQASAALRQGFMNMLELEKQKIVQQKQSTSVQIKKHQTKKHIGWLRNIAAAIVLIVAGAAITFIINNKKDNAELAELKNELYQMKEMMVLNELHQGSPSQRMQAVSLIQATANTNPEVVNELSRAALDDKSPNVRVAAILALARLSNDTQTADLFLEMLKTESNPLVQISLINALVYVNDARAINAFENILYDPNSLEEVKSQAKNGMDVFI
jgi:HEAT repeat protein